MDGEGECRVDIFCRQSYVVRVIDTKGLLGNFEKGYFHSISHAKSRFAASLRNSQATPLEIQPKFRCHLKPAELPTFDGFFEKWTSFKEMFNSLIDKNVCL